MRSLPSSRRHVIRLPRPPQPRLRDHKLRAARRMRASIRAAPEGLRSPRPLADRAERGAGDAGEFLLRQAGLEPGRRHERAIDFDDMGARATIGLSLGIGEGVLKPGEETVKIVFLSLISLLYCA